MIVLHLLRLYQVSEHTDSPSLFIDNGIAPLPGFVQSILEAILG